MKNKRKAAGVYTRVSTGREGHMGLEMQQKECIRILKELWGESIDIKCNVDEGFAIGEK